MWQEHVLAHGIGTTGITDIEFTFVDVEKSKSLTQEVYTNMTNDGIKYFLAPYSSGITPYASWGGDHVRRGSGY